MVHHHNHKAVARLLYSTTYPGIDAREMVKDLQSVGINDDKALAREIDLVGSADKVGRTVGRLRECLIPKRCKSTAKPLVILMVARTGKNGQRVECRPRQFVVELLEIVEIAAFEVVAKLQVEHSSRDADCGQRGYHSRRAKESYVHLQATESAKYQAIVYPANHL